MGKLQPQSIFLRKLKIVTWFYQKNCKNKDVEFHSPKNLLKNELEVVLGNVQHNHENTLLQDKVVNLQGHLKGLEERLIKGM
jgi:hypothetical protein